jgi:hypothetical protein
MAAGQRGACKLCESIYAEAINKMIVADKNQGEIKRALYAIDPVFSFSKPTFYDHKRHITHPLVTAQKAALANPLVIPKTNRGALEAIRDIGMQKAIQNPDIVTIDQSLKAIGIMEAGKQPVDNFIVILAKKMADPSSYRDDVIEGEFTEIEEEALDG